MKHHSNDYKLSAIKYYNKIKSIRKTCDIFNCSKSSLQRWIIKYKSTKSFNRKLREKKNIFTNEELIFIKNYVKNYPNITIKILTKIINKKFNKNYHYLSIYYLVKKLRISYKILRLKYFPKKGNEKNELCLFYKDLLKNKIDNIISIDETGIYINMTRERGYSNIGKRAVVKTDIYPYKKYNFLCAIKYGKIIGYEIYKEAIDKDKFIDFLNKNIKNKYKNHLLLLDNAKFHHNKNVKDFIINSNNNFLYTVRYHSENNPIENFFNQMKHYIKLKSPQTLEEIEESIKYIVNNNIKVEHLENYFKHVFIRGNHFIKKC